VGAPRIRLVAVKNQDCSDFPLKTEDDKYADGVLLDLDAWVLRPR
jgi:2-methylfumaryl-CoA hydratase